MNGSGHLREDFSIPEHLCPLDLAKFAAALGPKFHVLRRYLRLLSYYQRDPGFEAQAQWVLNVLHFLAESKEAFRESIASEARTLGITLPLP